MATITSTATAVPAHDFTQAEIMGALHRLFALEPRRHAQILGVFENAAVQNRHGVLPFSLLGEARSISSGAALYREHATALSRRVALESLERAGLSARDVDLVISVSCTGFMIPSLDAHLANDLGLRGDVRRLPLTELGCMGGAAALSFAGDFVRAHPGATALVVAVELPTLSLQRDDLSLANLVSVAIFGDGAAAAVVTGREVAGPRIVATRSHLIPASLDEMGFHLGDGGFHMGLTGAVPDLLHDALRLPVRALLDEGHVALGGDGERRSPTRVEDLSFLVLHPGGRKILTRIEEALGLRRDQTQPSWDVLRDHGNMSSATVLFVLHEWMTRRTPAAGEYGILAAFGPGLSAELLLLQWN